MTEPLDTIKAYLDAFHAGDVEGMSAQLADGAGDLVGTKPRFLVRCADSGDTDHYVTIGAPVHASITRNTAYVVVPAVVSYYYFGQLETLTGVHFSIVLNRRDDSWRISAWA